jgi:RNA polymerase sigma factor (sigma-70 family)
MPKTITAAPDPDDGFRARLDAARAGDERAKTALFEQVHATLHRRAARRLASLGTLADPSALVVSAINSLLEKLDPAHPKHARVDHITEIGQVWAFVFNAVHQRIVESRRAAKAQKRGAAQTSNLGELRPGTEGADPALGADSVVAMADLVEQALAQLEPIERQVTELKLFAGLTMEQIAQALDRSKRAVEGDWTAARGKLQAFLRGQLGPEELP